MLTQSTTQYPIEDGRKKDCSEKETMNSSTSKRIALGVFTIDEANELRHVLKHQKVEFRARMNNGMLWIDLFGDARLHTIIQRWKNGSMKTSCWSDKETAGIGGHEHE